MSRALFVTNDFPPMVGGEARLYGRICRQALPGRVLVLAPRLPGDVLADAGQPYSTVRLRVPVSPHPAARLLQLAGMYGAARALVRSGGVRCVHVGHLYLGTVALLLRRRYSTPYVVYLHGGEMAPYMRRHAVRRLARQVVEAASLVVANSQFTLAHYEGMGIRPVRAQVLPPAPDTDRFRPDVDPRPAVERYGLAGCRVVLTVGRLVARKGHDVVLRALAELGEAGVPVRYVVAGTGPEEGRLRQLAASLGLAERVVFAGHVPDELLPSLYAACDVFAMPSRLLDERDGVEGFGAVFVEAGACGKPVVGGRSGGVGEAVVDGVTGLLVDPSQPRELADVLRRLLDDEGLRRRLGEAGRRHAERLDAVWREAVGRVWEAGG